MQPNQNTAGIPNRNAAAAPRPGVAGGAAPRLSAAPAVSRAAAGGVPTPATQGVSRPVVTNAASVPASAVTPEAKSEKTPEQNIMAAGVSEKKKGKGMVLGLILLALLAAGGIGFGVWAMMDGNSQVAKKDATIKDLKQQNSDLLEQLDNASATTDDPGANEAVNTEDYIYVGEWGLKIKIPEGLSSVSYDYTRNSNGPALAITGAEYGGVLMPNAYPIGSINVGIIGLGSVQRFVKGAEIEPTSPPSFVFSDDSYDYYYHTPQELYQVDSVEEEERQNSIVKLVKEMFTTPENYSKM